jgi:hypothetical protein
MANSESASPVAIVAIVVLAISCLLSSSYFSLFASTYSAMVSTASRPPSRERVAGGMIVAK